MTELSCARCHALAAELALNIVTADERADAQAHLVRCESCRQRLSALADTAGQIELLPPRDPPGGFEQRTLSAFTSPHQPPSGPVLPRTTAVLTTALAGEAALSPTHCANTAAGPAVQGRSDPGARTVLYAPPTSHEHRACLHPASPSWIYVPADSEDNGQTGTTSP